MNHSYLITGIPNVCRTALISQQFGLRKMSSVLILFWMLLGQALPLQAQGFPKITQTQYAKIGEVNPNGNPTDTASSPTPRTAGLDYIKGYLVMDTRGIYSGGNTTATQVWNIAAPANPSEIVSARRGLSKAMHTYTTLLPSYHRSTGGGHITNNVSNPLNIVNESPSGFTPIDNGSRGLTVFPYQYGGGTNVQIYDTRTMQAISTIPVGFDCASTPIGNLLILAGIRAGERGFATYDISDPADPILLDYISPKSSVWKVSSPSYEYAIWKHFLVLPLNVGGATGGNNCAFVSFEDPTNLIHVLRMPADNQSPSMPGRVRYAQFQDNKMFVGSGIYDMSNLLNSPPTAPTLLQSLPHDGEYMLPLGNLFVSAANMGQGIIEGIQNPGDAAFKMRIFAHESAPDTKKPTMGYHNPKDGAANQHVKTRVGVVINETLDYDTITSSTFRVYPVSPTGTTSTGADIAGSLVWHDKDILNFTPNAPLAYDQRYRVHLVGGGIKDVSGNSMDEFSFYFTTESLSRPRIGPFSLTYTNYPNNVNQAVTFSTTTIGGGVAPLNYTWTFGDGTQQTSTTASSSHAYAAAGHHTVQLQVKDSSNPPQTRSATIVVTVVADQPSAPVSTKGSQMALKPGSTPAGTRIWMVNPDYNSVSSIRITGANATGSNMKTDELIVGADPRSIALDAANNLWVTCIDVDRLEVHSTNGEPAAPPGNGDPVGARVSTPLRSYQFPYGSRPHDVVFNADKTIAYVTLMGSGKVVRINPNDGTTSWVVIGDAIPSATAIAVNAANNSVLVNRFISPDSGGEVKLFTDPRTSSLQTPQTIALSVDTTSVEAGSSARGLPNYLADVAIDPRNAFAYVTAKKDNILRGGLRDGNALSHDSTVRTMISKIDLSTGLEVYASRLDIDDSSQPTAMVFSRHGDYLFIAMQGNRLVKVMDTYTGDIVATLPCGNAPQGLCFEPETNQLFINSGIANTVDVYDLTNFLTKGTIPLLPSRTIGKTINAILTGPQARGKAMFYNASDEKMSFEGYLACATCHQDGGHDGRVWDFTDRGEGLRNTTDLRGRGGMRHGNVHWTGNFNEIADFENDIRNHFGGTGFIENGPPYPPLSTQSNSVSSGPLFDLTQYVASLQSASVPRSPHRTPSGELTIDALLGRALFNGKSTLTNAPTVALSCLTCHAGNQMVNTTHNTSGNGNQATTTELRSNTQSINLGTIFQPFSGKAANQTLNSINTPTLMGIHDTPPYLHFGQAATLEAVFEPITAPAGTTVSPSTINRNPGHDLSPTGFYPLTSNERTQLLAYLRQIDREAPNDIIPPAAPSNFTHIRGANSLTLNWTASTATDLLGYIVFRSIRSGELGTASERFTGNSYVDTNIDQRLTYYYTVRALDTSGNISASSVTNEAKSPLQAQTITFSSIGNQLMTSPNVQLTATASSGLPVSYSVVSGPATVSGSQLTLVGSGTVILEATQAGDATYAATFSSQTFSISKASQTITFANIGNQVMTSPIVPLTATASSGLPVSYSVVSGPATVSGSQLILVGSGTVTLAAAQAGNVTYAAAATVNQTFSTSKASQTITFPVIGNQVMTSPSVSLGATASSGLTVSYSVVSGPATVSGSTLTLTGSGTVTVQAAQIGNVTYAAAASATQTFSTSKASQTITFADIGKQFMSNPSVQLTATASSGLPVSYSVVSGPATVSGSTLTLTGIGTVNVQATQEGNLTYAAATAVDKTFNTSVGWSSIDVGGSLQIPGSGNGPPDGSRFTLTGGGTLAANITSDKFRYVYTTLTGDGSITVRLRSRTFGASNNDGSLAGIMIRENTDPDSKYFMLALRRAGNNPFRSYYRLTTGAAAVQFSWTTMAVPDCWLKIVRAGNTFYFSRSTDGLTWISSPGSQNQVIVMSPNVTIGFVVSSINTATALDSAEFEDELTVP
jgi:Bacterial Ig-like domain/PKD domain